MSSKADRNPNCERWMWIELIGFENEQSDHNVPAFLDNCGFVPGGICLLFSTPDFVHTHRGLDEEWVFPPDYCSYGGKPYNAERQRQPWTNHQLRSLVDELHEHGIKVFPTLFNIFLSEVDGELYRSPWSAAHPELWETLSDGQPANCLNPLKRLADGTYYEDLLRDDLVRVVRDYGFDGFHSGDGYSSSRHPIWLVDYSDDMVEQFVTMMGVSLPFPVLGGAASPEQATARSQYIWQNLRREWCEFYARRNAQLLSKVCGAMHELGGEVVLNNAWTRDPFEAYYRYGVDYRRVIEAGVDRLVLETVGAGVSIGAENGFEADLRYDLNFMLANTRACLPETPLLCLNGTGDTTENWDLLNHAPAVSEREIYTLGSMFVQDADEKDAATFTHASSGPFVCLADGITRPQWQWLRENWEVAYEQKPTRVPGATVLWSQAAREAEFDEYVAHRLIHRQRVSAELQKRGAPLNVVVESAHLGATTGCLLVPRPELLPPAELAAVLAYNRGPVVTIGRQSFPMPPAACEFAEGPGPEQLCCRVYNAVATAPCLTPRPQGTLPAELPEPPNYLHQLFFREVSDEFLQACADLLTTLTCVPRVVSDSPHLRLLAYETSPSTLRLLVGNEAYLYVVGRVDLGKTAKKVDIASHFPGRPIYPVDTIVDIRVPPRGMIVLDIETL